MNIRSILCCTILAAAVSGAGYAANEPSSAAFEKVKQLSGTWSGKDEEGLPATVKYDVMSGGSIVTESLKPQNEPEMLTVYHLDGDKLLCTHYCSRNNQPRMRLDQYDAAKGKLDFDFIDATNLPDKEQGHMHHLVLELPDKDHLRQEWSWHESGQESKAIFDFKRQ